MHKIVLNVALLGSGDTHGQSNLRVFALGSPSAPFGERILTVELISISRCPHLRLQTRAPPRLKHWGNTARTGTCRRIGYGRGNVLEDGTVLRPQWQCSKRRQRRAESWARLDVLGPAGAPSAAVPARGDEQHEHNGVLGPVGEPSAASLARGDGCRLS